MMLLRLGSKGPDVVALQRALENVGFDPGAFDGAFGPVTDEQTRAFQAARGLVVDGVVGWPDGPTATALRRAPVVQVITSAPIAAPAAVAAPTSSVPADAATLATNFEGFSTKPYWDPRGGVWTYLFGSTRDPAGEPVTAATPPGDRALGLTLMRRDMEAAGRAVAADVHVPLTEPETAALDDFIYNVGAGNFRASTLLRKLNAGDHHGAADELLKWDRAGGVVLAGLLRRHAAERAEFLRSTPPAG